MLTPTNNLESLLPGLQREAHRSTQRDTVLLAKNKPSSSTLQELPVAMSTAETAFENSFLHHWETTPSSLLVAAGNQSLRAAVFTFS
jgi:hypothetical protein